MFGQPLRIGLLAHTQFELRTLRNLVEECGHQVASSRVVAEFAADRGSESEEMATLDAWVLALESEAAEAHWLDDLDRFGSALIFCDGTVPNAHQAHYLAWAKRLKQKLEQLGGAINLSRGGSARQLWVLAASTGGPAAVRQFLSELPPNLGVGFVYVQHIDAGFKDTLAQAIGRGTHYPAHLVKHGSVVRANEVAIVSPDHATELLPNGTFVVSREAWSAPYRPSADYMVANVANRFGKRSGVIVFTGMGDDGASGSRLMRQKGGRVWVQSPETCTSDSMPQAALSNGCVEFQGSPTSLAQQFIRLMQSTADRSTAAAPCES